MPKPSPPPLPFPIPSKPMLVVGDIMCDHYVWGDVDRISPEAPVQVLRWQREADRPGGAANAAMNLTALGCRVHLAGVVGQDDPGQWLLDTLRAHGVNTTGVIVSPDRTTTLKTRILGRGQHILRIDREERAALSPADDRRLVAAIQRLNGKTAGVLCSDYSKGVLSAAVLAAALGDRHRFSVVDPKGRDFGKYRGAALLTPNEKELTEATPATAAPTEPDDRVRSGAEGLIRRMKFPAILVTRGGNGMDLFESRKRAVRRTHIPPLQRHEVFDVTGAGDTVAAVIAMAASAGMPLADAARVANAAAGIVVGMVGTAAPDPDTLASVMDGQASQVRSKVLSPAALAARVSDARAHGSTVVFASGRFDKLTVSDLRTLQQARARGDLLVVGINDDLTGADRAEMVAALRFVDYVALFSERTPSRLIRALRPDVIV